MKFVDSAEECPSTSSVTLQLRDANARTAKIGQEGSTVASTSSPKQYLKSLEFSKQLSDVFTQIQRDISCKLDVNFRLPGI